MNKRGIMLMVAAVLAAVAGFGSATFVYGLDWHDTDWHTFDTSLGDFDMYASHYYEDNTSSSIHLWYANQHLRNVENSPGLVCGESRIYDGGGNPDSDGETWADDPIGPGETETVQYFKNETYTKNPGGAVTWEIAASYTGSCGLGTGTWITDFLSNLNIISEPVG